MTPGHPTVGREPPLTGRDTHLRDAIAAADRRPGLILIAGEPGSGTTRLATELTRHLTDTGHQHIRLLGTGTLTRRLGNGLNHHALGTDPAAATDRHPYTTTVGDIDTDTDGDAITIGQALAGRPGLLIATTHTPAHPHATVRLTRLTDTETAALIDTVAPWCSEAQRTEILTLAQGRPGVIVTLARTCRPDDRRAAIRIPDSIAAHPRATLAALPPPQHELLKWLTLLPATFNLDVIGRLPHHRAELASVLAALRADETVTDTEGEPDRYRLTDPLLAAVIRQTLPTSDTRARHAALLRAAADAGVPAADRVAHAVGSVAPAQIVEHSLRAAQDALDNSNPADALEHADRALAWCDTTRTSHERLSAELQRARAIARLDWASASVELAVVGRRLTAAGRLDDAMLAATELARSLWHSGKYRDALAVLTNQAPHIGPPSKTRAAAYLNAAQITQIAGRHTTALNWGRNALADFEAVGDCDGQESARNLIGVAAVLSTGDPTGLQDLQQVYLNAVDRGNWRTAAVALNLQAAISAPMGFARTTVDLARQGLAVVETHSVAELDAPLQTNLAEGLSLMAKFGDARLVTHRCLRRFGELGGQNDHPQSKGLLAWLLFQEGKAADALIAIRDVSRTAMADPDAIEHTATVSAYHIHCALEAGAIDEAQTVARIGIDLWFQTEDRVDGIALLGAACIALPADETARIRHELGAIAAAGAPMAQALCHYADADRLDGPAAAETFRAAAEVFAQHEMAWWSARALMRAGITGGPDGAADLLAAHELFTKFPALPWRAQCDAALRAIGHRVADQVDATRRSDLRPRDVEILTLLAAGAHNYEIADALFISKRTVERHLARIFTTLGASTRAKAVAVAQSRGLIGAAAGGDSPPT